MLYLQVKTHGDYWHILWLLKGPSILLGASSKRTHCSRFTHKSCKCLQRSTKQRSVLDEAFSNKTLQVDPYMSLQDIFQIAICCSVPCATGESVISLRYSGCMSVDLFIYFWQKKKKTGKSKQLFIKQALQSEPSFPGVCWTLVKHRTC